MRTYVGVGERIRERLLASGYRKADGEPDVQRFCWDHRFDKTLLYAWLRETMTPFKELVRLCMALDCSIEWLLTGNERGKAQPRQGRGRARKLLAALTVGGGLALSPSLGVAAPAQPLSVVLEADAVHLIGRLRRKFLELWPEIPECSFRFGTVYA